MDQLPVGINSHTFRFLYVIRDSISEFQAFSCQREPAAELHIFDISLFLDKKITDTIAIMDDMYERLGVRVGVDDSYFRPSLRRLYESQFLGHLSVNVLDYCSRYMGQN